MSQATLETSVPDANGEFIAPAPLPTLPQPVMPTPTAPEPVSDDVFIPLTDAQLVEMAEKDDPQSQEIWEAMTDANVWVKVFDLLNENQRGGWRLQRVGKGAKRIQLSVYERRYNQSLVPEQNISRDPFSNGQLRCVAGSTQSPNAYTDSQLIELLGVEPQSTYVNMVNSQTSEIVLRRMLALAEKHTHRERFDVIRDVIDERYKVGKRQRTVEEYERDEREAHRR